MGRTIPSFRIAFEMEKEEWKPFRNALDKSDRKKFDKMLDISRLYISACSNSVQYVRLHPILISILLHQYKQLTECTSEVEQMMRKMERMQRMMVNVQDLGKVAEVVEKENSSLPSRQLKLLDF
jgi:hypothetical protein